MIRWAVLAWLAFAPFGLAQPPADALPQLAAGDSLGKALGIAAVPNLRDLGGYKTRDGATVARRLAYRSGALFPLRADDLTNLAPVGLKAAYDLRTDAEMKARPDAVPAGVRHRQLNVLADSKSSAQARLQALLRDPKKAGEATGDERVEAIIAASYREFVTLPSAKKAYRELFLALADPQQTPAVFHCTTGKDRSGWAAAALLTLLGVPREAVTEDFLRSNDYVLPGAKRAIDGFAAAGGDRAIPLAAYGVTREYLDAAFDEMQKTFGTVEDYFAKALGIDAAGQKALRARFLEK